MEVEQGGKEGWRRMVRWVKQSGKEKRGGWLGVESMVEKKGWRRVERREGRVVRRGKQGEKEGRAGWTRRMEKSSLEGKSRVERKDGGGWLGRRSRV